MGNIKNIKYIGNHQTYNLEVDHPDHQFYLSNGVLTSNSHSIFYSFLGYQTAYLKAHFPLEFLTANLMFEAGSNAANSADNIVKIKSEIRKQNIKIIPPDINKSKETYTIVDDHTLMTGFDALKHMGNNAVPEIIKHRPYSSFEDFLSKVDGRLVNSKSVQAMIASGCLDCFGMSRKQMYLYVGDFKSKLQVWNKKKKDQPFIYPWPEDVGEWTLPEKFAMEQKYIGEGLCCKLVDAYPGFFTKKAVDFSKLSKLFPDSDDPDDRYELSSEDGIIEGVVRNYFEFTVKKEKSKIFGQSMAKIELEDPYSNILSMTLFPSGLEKLTQRLKELGGPRFELKPGIAMHCAGSLNWYDGNLSFIFNNLKKVAPPPPEPKDQKARKISMRISSRTRTKTNKIDPQELLENIEDELVEDGII